MRPSAFSIGSEGSGSGPLPLWFGVEYRFDGFGIERRIGRLGRFPFQRRVGRVGRIGRIDDVLTVRQFDHELDQRGSQNESQHPGITASGHHCCWPYRHRRCRHPRHCDPAEPDPNWHAKAPSNSSTGRCELRHAWVSMALMSELSSLRWLQMNRRNSLSA